MFLSQSGGVLLNAFLTGPTTKKPMFGLSQCWCLRWLIFKNLELNLFQFEGINKRRNSVFGISVARRRSIYFWSPTRASPKLGHQMASNRHSGLGFFLLISQKCSLILWILQISRIYEKIFWKIMKICWATKPAERSSFADLEFTFSKMLQK